MCNSCENNHQNHNHASHSASCAYNSNNKTFFISKIVFVFIAYVFIIIFKPENSIAQYFELNSDIIKFLIFFILYLIIAKDIVLNAFKNLATKKFLDENFLMTIATFGAFAIGEYPEALMVMLLYQVGEFFTDYALLKSKKSISSLMDLKAEYANLITKNGVEKTAPENIKPGDVILIKPGEKIPLDGVIIEGSTSVDTSNLTGEALPISVKSGDNISSGCINLDGVIKIRVLNEFQNSTVSKIIEMVQNASNKKAPAEKFITKFAKIYTPAVVVLAAALIIVPTLFGAEFLIWFKRALTFLVISCPCALVISVPLGFFASVGAASKQGILIKGGNYIEALSKTKTIVFDKTGTLTSGIFKVLEIHPEGISKEDFIKFAAHAEHFSAHPIARSIQAAYSKKVKENNVKYLKETPGLGITAEVCGQNVIIGNSLIMEKFNISHPKDIKGKTVIYMALNGEYKGFLTISDTIKNGAIDTLLNLKKEGIEEITVLTGDKGIFGLEDTKNVSLIDKTYCNLLPNQKLEHLEKFLEAKKDTQTLAFVGDGINDAPVLTRADVGIAMGKMGSDAAIDAADVVIMDDNLKKIPIAIEFSKKTINVVKQNIVFILFVKALFLILGAFGMVSMWGAVFADVGVTILAILNSIRILYFKPCC